MNKRFFAVLLALLLTASLPALAESPPASAGSGATAGQVLPPVPTADPEPSPEPEPSLDPEPSPEPEPSGPTPEPAPGPEPEEPPGPTPPGQDPPEPSPELPPEDQEGCDTQRELVELLREDPGGVITLTGDVEWTESVYSLAVRNPTVIEMGDCGIRVLPEILLDLSGPIRLVGSGVQRPLLHVEGYLSLGDGAEVLVTGDSGVGVLLDGALWYNHDWAAIRAEGEGAVAVRQVADGDPGDEVELRLTRIEAPGEGAVGIDAQVPVRLIQSAVEAGGASVVSTGEITLDGSTASPMPQGARVIRRSAAPGSWYDWLGISVTAAGEWPLEFTDNTIYYDLFDPEGREITRSLSRQAVWSGLPPDLSAPGDYRLTCTPEPLPEWYPLNIPAFEMTLHVVEPDRLWLSGVTMTSFDVEQGQLQLNFLHSIPEAELVEVLASADGGRSWAVVSSETPRAGSEAGSAWCQGLKPDTLYLLQARVTGGPMEGLSNTMRFPFTSGDPDQLGGGDWDGGDRDDQGDLPPAEEEVPPPDPAPEEPAEDPTPEPEPEEPAEDPAPEPEPPPGGTPEIGGARPVQVGEPEPAPQPAPEPPAAAVPPPGEEAGPGESPRPEPPPVQSQGAGTAAEPAAPPVDPPEPAPPADTAPMNEPVAPPPPAQPAEPAPPGKREPAGPAPIPLPALCAGALALGGGLLLYGWKKGGLAARPGKRLALVLALSLAASCLTCWLCWRYDNKYTAPRPRSDLGTTTLDMDWYDAHPLFYLADGWAFYQGRLLSPEEIGDYAPDAFFYLGRYGGYDLGDRSADPHGQGTYRTVVALDGQPRRFALELPPIFSRWRLWVNGQLMGSVGMGDENAPAPARDMVTFTAGERIDIVVETADDAGYYSGMVYPPALGSPQAVGEALAARGYLHGAAAALALASALACLLAGALLPFARPYRALALLCLCLAGTTAGPALHSFGLAWTGSTGQRACCYGIFLALIWTVGRVCGLPRKLRYVSAGAGAAVCALVLLQPLLPVERAGTLFALSAGLGLYKLLTALLILASGAWALRRGRRGSAALLTGGVIFAGALVMDRLLPVYEPIRGGWFVELAGWAILVLIGGSALWDAAALNRAEQALRTELAVRNEHARLQQAYVRQTRERLHESQGRLTLISHYLDQGEHQKLRAYLDGLLAPGTGPGSCQYTGNTLVDAVLTVELARAERAGVAVELDLAHLPAQLPYADEALTSLLMNLLDNALEANERLPVQEERWLTLEVERQGDGLRLRCVNAAPPPDGAGTSKPEKAAHGFGLPLLRKIAEGYGGGVELKRLENCCSVTVTLEKDPGREEAPV